MNHSQRIENLREKIGQIQNRQGREILSTTSLPAGVPRGALIELAGPAKIEWLLAFFKEHEEFRIFWIEEKFTLLPTAVQQRGVSLERMVFAEAPADEYFKTVRKALRSQAFEFIVVPSVFSEERFLKALQLLAERANACVFLLATRFHAAWPISVQLRVSRTGVSVQKHKNSGAL
jgi:hypothetical protein